MCVFGSLSVRRPSTVALAYLLFVLDRLSAEIAGVGDVRTR